MFGPLQCETSVQTFDWAYGRVLVAPMVAFEPLCFAVHRLDHLGEGVPPLMILPIYLQLPADLQSKVFHKICQHC